jgi:hypothetical protein
MQPGPGGDRAIATGARPLNLSCQFAASAFLAAAAWLMM